MTKQQIESGNFHVIYAFSGRCSQQSSNVAEAVCNLVHADDLEWHEDGAQNADGDDIGWWGVNFTHELYLRVAAYLADGWDRKSIAAVLEHCAFSVVEKGKN